MLPLSRVVAVAEGCEQREGAVQPRQIVGQEVSAIPIRFELLINGEIPAATLPDPLASGAIAAGAVAVVDDTTVPELSQSILAFSTEALEAKLAIAGLAKSSKMRICFSASRALSAVSTVSAGRAMLSCNRWNNNSQL